MPAPAANTRKFPLLPVLIGAMGVVVLLAGVVYLNRPAPKRAEETATAEAKAYLPYLELSDVTMKATENFMKQQVIEVEGNIGNKGSKSIQSIAVYCFFYGVDGHEIHRERVAILESRNPPLLPGQSRHFRLPFDNLPDGWNQVLPKMVIAQIGFAG